MSKKNASEKHKIKTHTAALLLMIVSADENIQVIEESIVRNIISDFFNTSIDETNKIINEANILIRNSTDTYHIANYLNSTFNREEKINFLYCIFEVAYSDKDFHYMERHLINQITNIMNIKKSDLLNWVNSFNLGKSLESNIWKFSHDLSHIKFVFNVMTCNIKYQKKNPFKII